jgi:transposase
MVQKTDTESIVRDIKRRTRKKYSSEEKIRIVLEGLRGNRWILNEADSFLGTEDRR